MTDLRLLRKYNIPVPRYTSYPTVPFWNQRIEARAWKAAFIRKFKESNRDSGISLYLHLPFCESLCTYCGCNKRITTNHGVEEEYLSFILKEWDMYREWMTEVPLIRELHLGGGTPTFFSPANLGYLVHRVLSGAQVHPDAHLSFEGHPNNTTKEHLDILFQSGFRRVSYGVQDHDPEVQKIINRIQPFAHVERATCLARASGYGSVNFDLIYGLPLQTQRSMRQTILQSISLRPDRVAFYSYAHVPWTSKGQRLFDERDLPDPEQKLQLYLLGRELFLANGYRDIGMDHFALPADELYIAREQGKLHRNFMGYTTHHTSLTLGLGVSAISDTGTAYAQNNKTLHGYYSDIGRNEPAVEKGYFLSEEDISFRQYILDISCNGKTVFAEGSRDLLEKYSFPELEKLKDDGLIIFDEEHVELTMAGRNFIRNICRAFDLYILKNNTSEKSLPYSKAI
jgi:oxygen-independent coproporphyrinogen-3 oxidase